ATAVAEEGRSILLASSWPQAFKPTSSASIVMSRETFAFVFIITLLQAGCLHSKAGPSHRSILYSESMSDKMLRSDYSVPRSKQTEHRASPWGSIDLLHTERFQYDTPLQPWQRPAKPLHKPLRQTAN